MAVRRTRRRTADAPAVTTRTASAQAAQAPEGTVGANGADVDPTFQSAPQGKNEVGSRTVAANAEGNTQMNSPARTS